MLHYLVLFAPQGKYMNVDDEAGGDQNTSNNRLGRQWQYKQALRLHQLGSEYSFSTVIWLAVYEASKGLRI